MARTPPKKKTPAKAMSRWRRLLRLTFRLGAVAALIGAIGFGYGAWIYKTEVLDDPGPQFERAAILGIIAQESPVLFRDGSTRIGVFFDQEHREYVPYDHIPAAWVAAITAAEDSRFFTHHGVDPKGIARAMVQNLKAGHVVAGGSTLTQQTAKNLFYRPDRSLRSKLEELENALRLEAHYSKEEILEFYANQFHVSANGRGLGIAARYFFDKEVEQLQPIECAFLAGMVKAPATYNPFIGASEERRARATRLARARTGYVLDRMLELGSLSQSEHDRLVAMEIPFKRGTFRYDTHIILDEVALRLEQAPFPQLFADLGIDNPSTAGIKVVTTIDAGAQQEATWALWHHLTELGPTLEGQGVEGFILDDAAIPSSDPPGQMQVHDFRVGRVQAASFAGSPSLEVDVGGASCTVDAAAVERAATIVAQARKGERWRKAGKAENTALVQAIGVGSAVWVSEREEGICDLELRPELQGGLLVLEGGQIRAMVGGNDNRNFNRAITAKRQLGSTWKPLIYNAALGLGWSPLDPLDNRPQPFPFEGSWYYPRPDHQSEPQVSLAWAGTRSENVASIWLLYHLLDRLNVEQFKEVARRVGLTPEAGEDRQAWIKRVRDDFGVISTAGRRPELAWWAARSELLGDDQLDPASFADLASLGFGTGVEGQEAKARRELSGADRAARLRSLGWSWRRVGPLVGSCGVEVEALSNLALAGAASLEAADEPTGIWDRLFGGGDRAVPAPVVVPPASAFAHLRVRTVEGAVALSCGDPEGEGWTGVDGVLLDALAHGEAAVATSPEELRVDERLPVRLLANLARAAERRALVLEEIDPYELDALIWHPDFRTMVTLRYVGALANQLGVQAELSPVLSLPLGAVDISLEEAATMYQSILTAQSWSYDGTRFGEGAVPGHRTSDDVPSPGGSTLLIAEIRDREDQVLYRAVPHPTELPGARATVEMAGILRDVVSFGTGRRALDAVTVGGVAVPVGGKTGTTNSYKNAAFVGYVPVAGPEGWSVADGFVVAAYVGYDDNRPMRRGGIRVAGASGALPAWIGTAQGLASLGLLGEATLPPDLPAGYVDVPVDPLSGLPTWREEPGPNVRVHLDDPLDPATALRVVRPGVGQVGLSGMSTPVQRQESPPSEEVEPGLEEIWIEEMDPSFADPIPSLPAEEAPDPGEAGLPPTGAGALELNEDSGLVPRIAPGSPAP